jgi:diaminopimelate epimerase
MIPFVKALAYGNDFLYVRQQDVDGVRMPELARAMCERHTGIGADGLIAYRERRGGAAMILFNADGSRAEVSGNGVRGLAALIARHDEVSQLELTIDTEGGVKTLVRAAHDGTRQTFRASMGAPTGIRKTQVRVHEEAVDVVLLNIGNPQLLILGPLPDDVRFARLGSALEWHTDFPEGTNIEFVHVESPERVRIRIWERGVGPSQSSGTGSCASLVAAASFGGALRRAEVIAPGGTQLVEWQAEGVYLTGWAEILCDGQWLRPLPR